MEKLHTFGAGVAARFYGLHQMLDRNCMDIATIGFDAFDSDELLEIVYKSFIGMMKNAWVGKSSIRDICTAIAFTDLYVPCTKRDVFTGMVDLRNDTISNKGFVYFEIDGGKDYFFFEKVVKASDGWVAPTAGQLIKLTRISAEENIYAHKKCKNGDTGEVSSCYVLIKDDGHVIPCLQRSIANYQTGRNASLMGYFCVMAAMSVNAIADADMCWNVKTSEKIIGNIDTVLTLGVNEEHVKSLFYARSLPMSEAGRRRPIMHWVQAHSRRLRSGIDIDIRKHLRGITEFEMDGFRFSITNPVKQTP